MQLPVIITETLRHNHPEVMGVITARELVERSYIPYHNRISNEGYQHPTAPAALIHLIQDLEAGRVDLPRPVLLNAREGAILTRGRGGRGQLTLPENLYVIDGQTRIEALKRLIESDPARWENVGIPFAIIIGADEEEEMEYFVFVQASKGLAYDVATERLRRSDRGQQLGLPNEPTWRRAATSLSDQLARTQSWKGCVRYVGQPKARTTITSSALADSLKAPLKGSIFASLNRADQKRVLEAYWTAVLMIFPDIASDPQFFIIHKRTGAFALHTILEDVLARVMATGGQVSNPENLADTLRPALIDISGTTRHGRQVDGLDFWRAGSNGAGGAFSSDGGRRALAGTLRELLPPLRA